jgi:hypothetical protein
LQKKKSVFIFHPANCIFFPFFNHLRIAVGLFRKMGFVPCYLKADGTEVQDTFQSLMVRSEAKNRSTEFDVDDEKMRARGITPYILANQLWLASE